MSAAADTTQAGREGWDVLPYHVGPSELHFGMSDALVRMVKRPTLWTHSASRPTLIIGGGQDPGSINWHAVSRQEIAVVRRQAGGTSVLATPDLLGVDVAVPAGHSLAIADVTESYRWFGEVWVEALRSLGVHPHLVSVEEARRRPCEGTDEEKADAILRLICFGGLSPYEVTVDGRKLVGLAQVRRRNGVLWQSGIHLRFPADELAALVAGDGARQISAGLRRTALGLDEAVEAPVSLDAVRAAFLAALVDRLRINLVPRQWRPDELAHARAVAQSLVMSTDR